MIHLDLQFEFIKEAALLFADRLAVVDVVFRFVRERVVELLEQLLLLGRQVLRHVHDDAHELVAPAAAAELCDAASAEAEGKKALNPVGKDANYSARVYDNTRSAHLRGQ